MAAGLEDRRWMQRALVRARAAGRRGEVPIGSVVVRAGRLLGGGANHPVSSADPTAHAEIAALRGAARRVANYRLPGATLYVTLEPCLMCLGAMVHARLDRLVFGAPDPKIGATALLRSPRAAGLNHRLRVEGGLLAEESAALLRDFFRARRSRPKPGGGRARDSARPGAR